MSRVYNFSAGPAVLPEEVLQEVAAEMMDYNGTGMSVMEMSHRSKAFEEILETAEKDFRELLKIPDNYRWSSPSVRSSAYESDEKRSGRLYRDRSVGKKSLC